MTDLEIGNLVDKLSDKLGVAVDKVMPVAQETLDQFVARETLFAGICGVFMVVGIIGVLVGWFIYKAGMKEEKWDKKEALTLVSFIFVVVSALTFFICLGIGSKHVGNVIAPFAALIGL